MVLLEFQQHSLENSREGCSVDSCSQHYVQGDLKISQCPGSTLLFLFSYFLTFCALHLSLEEQWHNETEGEEKSERSSHC